MSTSEGKDGRRAALEDELRRLDLEAQKLEGIAWELLTAADPSDAGASPAAEDNVFANMATVARTLIGGFLILAGTDEHAAAELPAHVGLPNSTYFKRKREPSSLRLSKLRKIAQALAFEDWQICAVVGVPYRGAARTQ